MSDDGIEAVTLEDETNDVVRGDPSKLTTEDAVKPVPVTVIVKVEAPIAFELGEMSDVVGAGLFTVKVWALDVPPPGVVFVTVMLKVPAVVMSDDGIEAVTLEDETNDVVRGDPSKLTTDPETKPVPVTVIVKVEFPTVFESGEMELVVGTGLFTVKVWAFEVPPPGVGLTTVIANVPPVTRSAVKTKAVTVEDDTKDVARGLPSNWTVEDATNPVPVTVMTKTGSPAVFVFGEIELVVGTGLLTAKVWAFEVPPPGAGFVTVMSKVPTVVRSEARIAAVSWVDEM